MAGSFDELPAWFAQQWESPVDAVREWDDYLSGLYVWLRCWHPENMRRKEELVELISTQLERPEPRFQSVQDALAARLPDAERAGSERSAD